MLERLKDVYKRQGKVLAMISKPDYDPNSLVDNYQDIISDENSKVLLNQSTQGLFVPGSIFKMVTSLAYLRSGGDPDNYSYYCDGSISLQSDSGDSYIKCYDGEEHGQVDLSLIHILVNDARKKLDFHSILGKNKKDAESKQK